MSTGPTHASWTFALNLYDDLYRHGWQDMLAFRELVAKIAEAPEAAGLTAVTSWGHLLISPYTRYPDWFQGRHVKLEWRPDGRVRVKNVSDALGKVETWVLPIDEALEKVLTVVAKL